MVREDKRDWDLHLHRLLPLLSHCFLAIYCTYCGTYVVITLRAENYVGAILLPGLPFPNNNNRLLRNMVSGSLV